MIYGSNGKQSSELKSDFFSSTQATHFEGEVFATLLLLLNIIEEFIYVLPSQRPFAASRNHQPDVPFYAWFLIENKVDY